MIKCNASSQENCSDGDLNLCARCCVRLCKNNNDVEGVECGLSFNGFEILKPNKDTCRNTFLNTCSHLQH
jgi:hypothetical protein